MTAHQLFHLGALEAALGRVRVGHLPEPYLAGYLSVWLRLPQRVH